MSTPVVTDKWAGNFDCSVCRRKRLMAEEFSKKALEKHCQTGGPLKCKSCVMEAEEVERRAAAAKRQQHDTESSETSESRMCASCQKSLDQAAFNRNQWSKGEGKSRCRSCVEKSLADEASQQKQSKQDAIAQARQKVYEAKAKGNAQEILQAESVLSALEAEQVTGLKPVKMGRGGRGRGRSIRGGRGRGSKR